MDFINNLRNMKRGEKFYFSGVKYNIGKMDLKHATEDSWGWQMFAEAKKEQEGIYIRAFHNAYLVFNYAMQQNKTRQSYGSSGNVTLLFSQFIKKVFLEEENGNGKP